MAAEWMQGEPHKSREWLQPKSQYNAVEMCRPWTHATSACDFRFGVVPTSQSLPKQLLAGTCNPSFLHVGNTLLALPSHHNPVPNLLRFLLSHTHTHLHTFAAMEFLHAQLLWPAITLKPFSSRVETDTSNLRTATSKHHPGPRTSLDHESLALRCLLAPKSPKEPKTFDPWLEPGAQDSSSLRCKDG